MKRRAIKILMPSKSRRALKSQKKYFFQLISSVEWMIFSIKMQIVRRLMTALSHHPGIKIANELAINRVNMSKHGREARIFLLYYTSIYGLEIKSCCLGYECALSAF